MNTPSNPYDTGLYAQQVRQAMAQQQITTTSANTLWGAANTAGSTYTATPAPVQPWPQIESLQQLAPGWRYVRWRKDDDAEATAYSVPILALTFSTTSVTYVLGDATPNISPLTPTGVAHFLAVLSPLDAYDEQEWNGKARKAYYDFHAREVAERLLKGAPTAAPAA